MNSQNNNSSINIRRNILDGFSFAFLTIVLLIVIFNPTESQQLNLKLNSVIFFGAYIIGAVISHLLNARGIKTLGEYLFEPSYKKALETAPMFKSFWGWHLAGLLLLLFIVGIFKTKFSVIELLNEDGFNGAKRLFAGIASPNWQILPQAVLNIIETIFMAFMATVLAIPFAFFLSFVSARNIMNGKYTFWIYLAMRTVFNVTRSIEALLWAIIFSVWVGIGPFAGMLALMIHSIASLAKQYSEMVETVNEGPIEGVQSCGANKLQTIWFAIVPQVVLPFISFTVYRWDINVRMATIIGLVGGGGIGTMLIQYQGQAMWSEVGTIIVVIAAVVWIMDQASAYIREALK